MAIYGYFRTQHGRTADLYPRRVLHRRVKDSVTSSLNLTGLTAMIELSCSCSEFTSGITSGLSRTRQCDCRAGMRWRIGHGG